MAAGLLRLRHGKRIWVDSCGLRRGEKIDPFAVQVMDELGADLSKHRPKSFDELEDTNFDLIITLSPEAHHRALEFTRTMAVEVEYWPTFDPTLAQGSREQMLDEYRQVRQTLDRRIAERFPHESFGKL